MSKRSQTEINRACELLNTDENNNQTVKNIARDSFITDKNKYTPMKMTHFYL